MTDNFIDPTDDINNLQSLFQNMAEQAGFEIAQEAKENPLIDRFRIQMVPFHLLKVTEYQAKKFSWNHVKGINEVYHPALTICSSVLYYNGEYICWEGQHTAVLNWLNGMKAVPCIVFEDENMDFKENPTVSKFDKKELLTLFNYLIEDIQPETIDDIVNHLNEPSRRK